MCAVEGGDGDEVEDEEGDVELDDDAEEVEELILGGEVGEEFDEAACEEGG